MIEAREDEKEPDTLFKMPYRYVYAIATEDSIFFYDTQSLTPFSYVTGIHYCNLSDINWSNDGRILIVTSIDGFCTFIMFEEKELGIPFVEPLATEL
jgi:chromatin assembly factor 1 subunit B